MPRAHAVCVLALVTSVACANSERGSDSGATTISTASTTSTNTGTSGGTIDEASGATGSSATTDAPGCELNTDCEPDELCQVEDHTCIPAGDHWMCPHYCARLAECRINNNMRQCLQWCDATFAAFDAISPECAEAHNEHWYCVSQARIDCADVSPAAGCQIERVCDDQCADIFELCM